MKVWLKQLNQDEERYFIREVLVGCKMDNPNCIHYYGYSETPEEKDERGNIYSPKPIIVMEKGKESENIRYCRIGYPCDLLFVFHDDS